MMGIREDFIDTNVIIGQTLHGGSTRFLIDFLYEKQKVGLTDFHVQHSGFYYL